MNLRRFLIGFFIAYGMLIPVFAYKHLMENPYSTIAIIGSCFIMSLIFITGRLFYINFILAIYVTQTYLMRPYLLILESKLTGKDSLYINIINGYYNSDHAAVVYCSLFTLLLGWYLGHLLVSKSIKKSKSLPKIFRSIDRVISDGGLTMLITWFVLFILNYANPVTELREAYTGLGKGTFLWGMASLGTINIVFLCSFLKDLLDGIRPLKMYLLIPVGVSIFYGMVGGGRSAGYNIFLVGFTYWMLINSNTKWNTKYMIKLSVVFLVTFSAIVLIALFAQPLKSLYRYNDNVGYEQIVQALNYQNILLNQQKLYFGITEILHRVGLLEAQFNVLNDMYVHEPWKYINPIQTLMRIANDLVPGKIFNDTLHINQLYNHIYHDAYVHYASHMWGIQSVLYLYFGHYLGPLVTFYMALIINKMYPTLEQNIKLSPSFAAFFIIFAFAFITNATERVLTIHIIRPVFSIIIFNAIYKIIYAVTILRVSKQRHSTR